MRDMGSKNGMEKRGEFIPEESLKDIFTTGSLKQKLQADFNFLSQRQVKDVTQRIQRCGKKLYALLILMDESKLILKLLDQAPPVDDGRLWGLVRLDPEDPGSEPPYAFKSLQQIDVLSGCADALYKQQWKIPPLLTAETHHSFPVEHFVFPFASKPEKISNGSYGVIYGVEIAKGHLELPQGHHEGTKLVYKKVPREERTKQSWAKLLNEVNILRQRRHEHITPLLASFGAGRERQMSNTDTDEFLYMISPRAVGDMEEWMLQNQRLETKDVHYDQIHEAMMGLVSALAYIHKEFDGKVVCHHDIKPANILQFGEEKPVWKICDFGSSNLVPVDDTGTQHAVHTASYAPPEYFFKDGRKSGRADDVFSLGCVFLELATILRFGWSHEGLPEFRKLRIEHDKKMRQDEESFEADHSYWRNMDVVQEWIKTLHSDSGKRLENILKLVKEMLEDRQLRIFAWEVDVDLFEILNPDKPHNDIVKRLERKVQKSRKPINGLDLKHNPLIRAKNKGRAGRWLDVLRVAEWLDYTPRATEQLTGRTRDVVDEYFSTLPQSYGTGPLYGRYELDQQIAKAFGKADRVALCGLGGIGKTHMAYHYALRFKETTHKAKKHTFWVAADSVSSVTWWYYKIAETVNLPIYEEPTYQIEAVNNWLQNGNNGRWLMVVDGLDLRYDAKQIKQILPSRDCGQILITTRRRDLVDDLVPHKHYSEACIEVEPPKPEESLKIFERHIDGALYDANAKRTKELLVDLHLPLVMEMAAKYMTRKQIASKEMYQEIHNNKNNRFAQIEQFQEDKRQAFMDFLLRPLLQQSSYHSDQHSRSKRLPTEARLLSLLAVFGKEGVNFSLISVKFPSDAIPKVRDMLATLVSSAFLKRLSNDAYAMHEFVQLGVLRWIKEKEGRIGVLQHHDMALAMLHVCYVKDKGRKHGPLHEKEGSSYLRKLPYMPHFERFWLFTMEDDSKSVGEFWLHDHAVMAIVTFCHVYIDQGRHDDAIQVLEFAQKHCKGEKRWDLGRNLIKAYLSRPSGRNARLYWDKSEKILQELTNDAGTAKKPTLRWDLLLDRVAVCRKSQRYREAWKALKPLEKFKLHVQQEKPILPNRHTVGPDLNPEQRKRLAIRVRREEGLIRLARGQNLNDRNRTWWADRDLRAARSAFKDCKVAVKQWFRKNKEWAMEIKGNIADADTKIATPELLTEAEEILRKRLKVLKRDFPGGRQRIWDTECKIAAVKLKGSKEWIAEAASILQSVLESAESFYGDAHNDGQVHSATRNYAYQYRKALVKAGRNSEVVQLEKRFPGMQRMKDDVACWMEWRYLQVAGSIFVALGALLLLISL